MSGCPDGRWDVVLAWPMGRLGVRLRGEAVSAVGFLPASVPERAPQSPAAARVAAAIEAYLHEGRSLAGVPVSLQGTAFRLRVWQALRGLRPGQVLSYGELAARLGSGARAVGGACRHNPVPLLVPCHRVVARNGPGGFAGHSDGWYADIKRWLLRHEGVESPPPRPY